MSTRRDLTGDAIRGARRPRLASGTLGAMGGTRAVVCVLAAGLLACSSPADPATAAAAGCGPFPQRAGASGASPGVRFEDATTEEAQRWAVPAGLSFEVLPPVTRGQLVEITGVLRNTSAAELEAYYLTGGLAFRSMNPFTLEVDAPLRAQEIPETPEVYPAPRRAVLPPGGEVRFVVELCPDVYQHAPGATSRVRWQFELWNEPKPSGVITITWPSP